MLGSLTSLTGGGGLTGGGIGTCNVWEHLQYHQ